MDLGRPLARGRTADIFADGPDRVWRIYRDGRDTCAEVAAMQHLARCGYPVPTVFEAAGPRMLLERIDGPTLGEYSLRRPWRLRWAGRLLRQLTDQLGEVAAPRGLQQEFGPGESVLHLDLHPMNVLLGPNGPVVIDWSNVRRGPRDVDRVYGWLLMRAADVPAPRWAHPPMRGAMAQYARALLPAGDPARTWIPAAVEHRLGDPFVTPTERFRLERLRD